MTRLQEREQSPSWVLADFRIVFATRPAATASGRP